MKRRTRTNKPKVVREEISREVKHSFDILDRIHELLNQKFDGKQKLLADKMGKSEAEISKWINGSQNFTIRTISKLEAAFDEPIIAVCSDHENAQIHFAHSTFKHLNKRVVINTQGNLQPEKFTRLLSKQTEISHEILGI